MGDKRRGVPGLSFSWKRAIGLTAAKARLSRQIGVPLSRAGRQRRVGAALGCCVPAAFLLVGLVAVGYGMTWAAPWLVSLAVGVVGRMT